MSLSPSGSANSVGRISFRAALRLGAGLSALALLTLAACKNVGEPELTPSSTPEASIDSNVPDGFGVPDAPEESDDFDSSNVHIIDAPEDEITYDETLEAGVRTLHVSTSFPRIGIPAVDEYYESVVEGVREYGAAFAEDLLIETDHVACSYSVHGQIIRNGDGVLSVLTNVDAYTGGAHNYYHIVCENFRLPDGARLSLDDVFTVPSEEYIPRLLAVFDAFIDIAVLAEESGGYSTLPRFFPGAKEDLRSYFSYDDYDTFCIVNGGLLFYFSPYELGPWISGTIVIPVPLGEIADIADGTLFQS
jgi:hypothetical protein